MRSYSEAGVMGQGAALSAVERHLGPTFELPDGVEVLTRFGGYASVLKLSPDLAVAISTDGVGSKTVVASALRRFDTIGFDCVAMNANDLLCVGATPIAMVDYLGVNSLNPEMVDGILAGLGAAAAEARIAIPGGELAQLPDVIGSDGKSPGDADAFDLVGTCIGTVHPDRIILGRDVAVGDAVIGLASSGLHSNGFTLARRVLLGAAGYGLDEAIPRLGRTLGDELLEPTLIYVRAATALWSAGIGTHGLVHITGDGFANLCRLETTAGFRIDALPAPPPVFALIREIGGLDDAEMYKVFNMGVGFVVIVADDDAQETVEIAGSNGYEASRIGTVVDEPGGVLVGPGLRFGMEEGEAGFRPL